jgi:hypothetical protein
MATRFHAIRVLLAVVAAALVPGVAAAQLQLMDAPEVAEYRISADALESFARAARALDDLQEAGVELVPELETLPEEELTLELLVEAFDREPRVRAAIAAEGMTPRSYVVFLLAVLRAANALLEYHLVGPEEFPEGVLRDNIEVLLSNEHLLSGGEPG